MNEKLPILYVKSGCPWCAEAVELLSGHGVEYREVNVSNDARAFSEMQKKSGQSSAPTLDWYGQILADFGVDELKNFLHEQNVVLEDS